MKKPHRILLGLGLMALLGLSAREARAETMSLTVELGGTSVYSITGSAQAVNADIAALNAALAGSGYTFSGLSGASNFPGSTGATGGFVSNAGNVSYTGTSPGATLTIIVTESGFTAPASGIENTLMGTSTAIYSGASSGTQTFTGNFTDSGAVSVDTPLINQTSTGLLSNPHADTTSAGVPTYVTPYTLTNTTTITLTASSSGPANDVFTGKTSITAVIPEPASLVMMVTGMPLPLVVMGLLRRRRGAA